MISYPKLEQLPPKVLEKVITKCGEKSYFRLQQTCRDIQEFIKNCENICIHLSQQDILNDCHKEGSSFILFSVNIEDGKGAYIPIENLYGVRLGQLHIAEGVCETTEELDNFLDILKKHQIQCEKFSGCVVDWTLDQFASGLDQLKPVKVDINTSRRSGHPGYYEKILNAKQVKEVSLKLGADDFFLVVRRFLTTYSVVSIYLLGPIHENIAAPIEYCHTILQILHTDSPQNLREFYFADTYTTCSRYPTEYKEPAYNICALVDLPETLPSNAFCEIRFGCTQLNINYAMRGADGQVMTKFPMNRNRRP